MIQKLINKIQAAKRNPTFLTKVYLVLGLLVVVSVYVGLSWMRGKRRAALLHKKDMLVEKLHKKVLDRDLAAFAVRRQIIQDDIDRSEELVAGIEKELEQIEEEKNDAINTIKKIKDVKDIEDIIVYARK